MVRRIVGLCDPPYERGLAGHWCRWKFPGVLRQDCYDYINLDYYCSNILYCLQSSSIKFVFSATHGCNCAKFDFYFGSVGTDNQWIESKELWIARIDLNSDGVNAVPSVPTIYSCNDPKKTSGGTDCCISGSGGRTSIQSEIITSALIGSLEMSEDGKDCVNVFVKLKCASCCEDPCTTEKRPPDGCHSDKTEYIAYSEDGCCLSAGKLDAAIIGVHGKGVAKIKICCNNCSPAPTQPPPVGACCLPAEINSPYQHCIASDSYGSCYAAGGLTYYPGVSCTTGANGVLLCPTSFRIVDDILPEPTPYAEVDFTHQYSSEFYSFGFDECFYDHTSPTQSIQNFTDTILFTQSTTSNCTINVQLQTTGCCLEYEVATSRIYAVGDGDVSSTIIGGMSSKCCPDFSLMINGKKNRATVKDGEYLIIESNTECKCKFDKPIPNESSFKPGPCHK